MPNSTDSARNASLLKSWESKAVLKGTAPGGHLSKGAYMTRTLSLALAFAVGAMAADLPVREVILYKSGVGYFERAGTLASGESARLDFKATDMNDVLKSLILEDRNGGKITGLRYDSSEPLDQKLAEFPFKIEGHASLSSFLDQV